MQSDKKLLLTVAITIITTMIGTKLVDSLIYQTDLIPFLKGETSINGHYVITKTENGYPIIVDKHDQSLSKEIRITGKSSDKIGEFVISLIKPGNTIIEVGSGFGYNTISIAKKISSNGTLYAYEANSNIFPYFQKTLILNDIGHIVKAKNIAIGSKLGSTSIEYDQCCIKNTSLISGDRCKKQIHLKINEVTLDAELPLEKNIDVMILDICGAEMNAVLGAQNIINNSPHIKIVFYWDVEDMKKYCDPFSILDVLFDKKFSAYKVTNSGIPEKISKYEIYKLKKELLVFTMDDL